MIWLLWGIILFLTISCHVGYMSTHNQSFIKDSNNFISWVFSSTLAPKVNQNLRFMGMEENLPHRVSLINQSEFRL